MRTPLLAACLLVMPVAAQEPTEHTLAELPSSRYFVLPARKAPPAPAKPALLVVLPGGDGSADFLSFFQNGIMANAPDDCVGVLVTAVRCATTSRSSGRRPVRGCRT